MAKEKETKEMFTARLSAEVKDRFQKLLESQKKALNLSSTDEVIDAVVSKIELENTKKNLPGLATVVDDYDVHAKAIHDIIVALMDSNVNAEIRAKKDFQRELEEKSQLISTLQKSVETLTDERDKSNETIKSLKEKVKLQAQTLTQQNETIRYQKEIIESLKQQQPSQVQKGRATK